MHIGLTLAQVGPFADPDSVTSMARSAEARGYSALWVLDRLLDPVAPRSSYPGTPDGALPEEQRIALDPLVTLATATAHTSRIRPGTNILVAPWYRPVLLTRSLAVARRTEQGSLGHRVGPRLVSRRVRRRRCPAKAAGRAPGGAARRVRRPLGAWSRQLRRLRLSRGAHRHPAHAGPITSTAGAARRLQPRRAGAGGTAPDGWTPAGLPLEVTASMWSVVTATAVQAGRDASELPLVVRANIQRTSRPLGAHRPTCHGSVEQIAADGRGALRVGAHQVILELQGTTSDVSEYFHLADAIVDAADVRTAA